MFLSTYMIVIELLGGVFSREGVFSAKCFLGEVFLEEMFPGEALFLGVYALC